MEKEIWRENWRGETHESDAGENVCDCRFLLIFPGHPNVTEQNTSKSNPWRRQRSCHLSTRFLPNKGEHLSSLYLPPFLPEQYVAGQERWQEERERGKHTRLTRFTHAALLSQASPPPICLSARLPLPLSAKWRRLISACSSCSYDAGSLQSDKQAAFDLRCERRTEIHFELCRFYASKGS